MEKLELEPQKYAFKPKLHWDEGVHTYLSQVYGAAKFDEICDALSRPSIHSCIRVNTLRTSREDVVQKLAQSNIFAEFSHPSRLHGSIDSLGTLQEEVRGLGEVAKVECEQVGRDLFSETIQTQVSKDTDGHCLVACGGSWDFSLEEHPLLDNVVLVRGQGPCEVDYTVPGGCPLKEVVVSRKCGEAVLRGANVFVPGVLACSGQIEKGDMVAVCVAVERPDGNGGWSVGLTRGTTLSSEHAKAQLDGYTRSGWFIGKGQAMLSRSAIFKENEGVAVHMVDRVYKLPPFNGLLKGEIFLQNLPSIVAARVLDPQPGERILDMCAAPGGKTTAIALLMLDKGEVIAVDRSHNKVRGILSLAEEMGLTCISAFKLDALKSVRTRNPQEPETSLGPSCATAPPPNEDVSLRSDGSSCPLTQKESAGPYLSKAEERKRARKMKSGPGRGQNVGEKVNTASGFAPGSFDRVLLDAPCSALGLRPRLFAGEETLDRLRKHGSYQRRMLDQAVRLVRPGGTLVYSTCTINPGENEAVVRYALDKYIFLTLVPQEPVIGGPGVVGGLDVFDGVSAREWLRDGEQHLVQRFDPSGSVDTIGFFIAKFHVAP